MSVDLHMHSNCSDGELPPGEVAVLAVSGGARLLSLTDHDTMSGTVAARAEAEALGAHFISGVEISSRWGGRGIHVVGLGLDESNPAIDEFFAGTALKRLERGREMGRRFDALGIHGAFEGALEIAGADATLSRTHFALWLLREGHVKKYQEAFDRYLRPHAPCSVEVAWPWVEESVAFILREGGIPVLAHPGRYHFQNDWMVDELLAHFKDAGGVAIEVSSGSQSRDDDLRFSELARRYGFLASTGSDWHSDRSGRPKPGTQPQIPPGLVPVWTKLGLPADLSKLDV